MSEADVEALKAARNTSGLIRLLGNRDFNIQWHAAEALAEIGTDATAPLISVIEHHSVPVRLGAIEALGTIRDTRAVDPLVHILNHDTSAEVVSAAAIALGRIGDVRGVEPLVPALKNPERYIRYSAARALDMLGWVPCDDTERTYLAIALQDWKKVKSLGEAAVNPLIEMLRDPDPATRLQCVNVLGQIGSPSAVRACERVLGDANPAVRWKAVLAAKKCGVPMAHLPWGLAKRKKTGRNPWAGAILNLLFLGLGYNYLGFWWGFLIFMSYMSIMVLLQLSWGPFLPYLFAYPITALFAVQTFYLAKKMPDS